MPKIFWSIFRSVFMRDRRDATSRSPGQSELLSAVRLQENKKMGDIIKAASIDDLEWFLQMLELQLEKTPHWVKDESRLHEIQAWTRRGRTVVALFGPVTMMAQLSTSRLALRPDNPAKVISICWSKSPLRYRPD